MIRKFMNWMVSTSFWKSEEKQQFQFLIWRRIGLPLHRQGQDEFNGVNTQWEDEDEHKQKETKRVKADKADKADKASKAACESNTNVFGTTNCEEYCHTAGPRALSQDRMQFENNK